MPQYMLISASTSRVSCSDLSDITKERLCYSQLDFKFFRSQNWIQVRFINTNFLTSKILYPFIFAWRFELIHWQEERTTYGTNAFFDIKQFSTEKGKKRPLNTSLLTKNVAAAANTYQDKKAWAAFFMLLCVHKILLLSLFFKTIKTHSTMWIFLISLTVQLMLDSKSFV